MATVYVLSKDGKPLDPTTRCGHVRYLLKTKKARVVYSKPFTIQLNYEVKNPDMTKRYILGIDPGRTSIGITVITENAETVYSANMETNNKDVTKHMEKRAMCRRASRSGERKRRQRRAISGGTCFPNGEVVRDRILPGCEEPIKNKYIINTEARFNNRKRPKGWLTPTANHLFTVTLSGVNKVTKILPITDIVLEANKFAFMALDNPHIRKWEYQKGPLKGYGDVKDAIAEQQDHHCIFCKSAIEHNHHIIPKHKGGSDTLPNMVGLCAKHHALVHTSPEWAEKLSKKKEGLNKKYGSLSVLNQITPYLAEDLSKLFPERTYITSGKSTSEFREQYAIDRDYHLNAYCIACSILDINTVYPPTEHFEMQRFRRHNRAIVNCQRERTYFRDGKPVAKNRKPRSEQSGPSLEDYLKSLPESERRKICSQLTVKKSTRYYNDVNRTQMPGDIFYYKGMRYVLSGQITSGKYFKAFGDKKTNFPAEQCTTVANRGWVYV